MTTEPIKILSLVHAYVGHGRNAGGETTLHDIFRDFVARGAQVDVILDEPTSFTEVTVIDGVTVHPYHDWDSGKFNVMARDTDIIMTHLDCSERATYVAQYCGKPMVHLVHNTFWQTQGYLSAGCDLAIYNSDWVANFHEQRDKSGLALVANTQNVEQISVALTVPKVTQWDSIVVHPPIDFDRYVTTPGDHITLVNLFPNKGAAIFYEMAKRFPKLPFMAVRGGYDKKEYMIPDVLPPNVRIVQNCNDFNDVLSRTRTLLMPSVYESFGRVALEAAASGIPTIASDTPGLREALGETGIYCPVSMTEPDEWGRHFPAPSPEDLDAWESAIKALQTKKAYDTAGALAKERTEYWTQQKAFEMDALWGKITKLYLKTKFG